MTVAPVHSSALPSPLLPSEVREDLIAYAEAGGFTLRAETTPWFAALDSVARLDEARAASTVLAELRGSDVPELAEAADRLGEVPGLDTPTTVARTAAAVALLQRVRETLTVLRPEAYAAGSDTLKSLAAATGSSAWRADQGVSQSWWRRSRLGRHARGLAAGRVRREDLHRALDSAATARADWSELALSGGQPPLPADLAFVDAAARAADAALTGLDRLAALIRPTTPLDELPLTTLATLLDDLADDEGTLYRLPRLHELRESLTSLGHGELLAELTSRQADTDATEAYLAEREEEASEAAEAAGALTESDDEATIEELVAEDAVTVAVTEPESESLTELPDQRQDESEAAAVDTDEADAAEPIATLPEQRQEEAEADAPADAEATAVTETQAEAVPATEDVTDEDTQAEPIAALPDQRREQAAPAAGEDTAETVAETTADIEDAADAPAESAIETEPIAEVEAEVEIEAPAAEVAELAVEVEVEAEPIAEDTADIEDAAEALAEPATKPIAEVEAEVEIEAPAAEVAELTVEVEAEPIAEHTVEVEEPVEAPAEPIAEVEPVVEAEAQIEPVVEAEAQVEPVVEAEVEVEAAPVAEAPVEAEPVAAAPAQPEAAAPAAEAPAVPAGKPEIVAGRPVTAYAPEELEALVRWLDADGTVRTDDELLRAAMKELGFSRLGPRIKDALGAAVAAARG